MSLDLLRVIIVCFAVANAFSFMICSAAVSLDKPASPTKHNLSYTEMVAASFVLAFVLA